MTDFTVEVTLAPVPEGKWTRLREVLDLVPGTVLIEAPESPVLIFPVRADDPMRAAMFVDGLSKLIPFEVRSGTISPLPEEDFESCDAAEADIQPTAVVTRVNTWMGRVPDITDDHLVDA